ncbi:MAG: hypothetical protein HY920_01685 [Elusimicrobia bacterium]|nr:hypothetical protein [Elusimicrobiota bacterium]
MQDEKKKKRKGLFSVLRESMTKTGGCCGSGETCGGAPDGKTTAKVSQGSEAEKD